MSEVVKGDPKQEEIQRYKIVWRDSAESCWPDVEQYLKQGKKVLWVCNTVKDALEVYKAARDRGVERKTIRLYHSRFRYRDRVRRQNVVIASFKPKRSRACLAITSQVCEMSLDISADLMVTSLPPLPALVQRLGRLNRYAERNDPWPCLVYPFVGKPYDEPEQRQQMEDARKMIRDLDGKACSQAKLAEYLDAMTTQETWVESSTWLEGGWQSDPMPAREGDTSITVIREEDLEKITRRLGPEKPWTWTAQRLVPWTVPVLAGGFRWERRVGPYPLAERDSVQGQRTLTC
jgi:CRISPR-associated endonuclease/helicase Cas3